MQSIDMAVFLLLEAGAFAKPRPVVAAWSARTATSGRGFVVGFWAQLRRLLTRRTIPPCAAQCQSFDQSQLAAIGNRQPELKGKAARDLRFRRANRQPLDVAHLKKLWYTHPAEFLPIRRRNRRA
jgi:hypothetical protein